VVDLEAEHTDALPARVCCAEESRRLPVTVDLASQSGYALDYVGDRLARPGGGCAGQGVIGVAVGPPVLALRNRDPSTRRQRRRQVPACRHGHGVVGPVAGRGEVAARQCNLSRRVEI
jgi:hypothetical protein